MTHQAGTVRVPLTAAHAKVLALLLRQRPSLPPITESILGGPQWILEQAVERQIFRRQSLELSRWLYRNARWERTHVALPRPLAQHVANLRHSYLAGNRLYLYQPFIDLAEHCAAALSKRRGRPKQTSEGRDKLIADVESERRVMDRSDLRRLRRARALEREQRAVDERNQQTIQRLLESGGSLLGGPSD